MIKIADYHCSITARQLAAYKTQLMHLLRDQSSLFDDVFIQLYSMTLYAKYVGMRE